MKLYTLLRGRSKNRLKPIMIDDLKKVQKYQRALQGSDKGSGKSWHYDIQPAEDGAIVWRKHNNYGKWTNYNVPVPAIVR
jgi:hypothetical protein